jgi:hypothetical protein
MPCDLKQEPTKRRKLKQFTATALKPLRIAATPYERWREAKRVQHAFEEQRFRLREATQDELGQLHEAIWASWSDVANRAQLVMKGRTNARPQQRR